MRIVLIGPTFPFRGGISHYTTLLYRELKKRHEVKFFSFSRPYPKFLFPGDTSFDKSKKPLEVTETERIVDWANPLSWLIVAKRARDFDPDLVIFPWWMWGWAIPFAVVTLLAKALTSAKILFICHNVIEHETAWWKKLLTKMALSPGDFYIVHSQPDFEKLKRFFPRPRIKKAFLPIFEIVASGKISRERAKKKLGIKGNAILFFGYVRPYKGLRYLFQALPDVLKQVNLDLIVAGEFWEDKESYQALAKELGIERRTKIFDQYIPNEELQFYFAASELLIAPYVSATGTATTRLAFGFEKPIVGTAVGDLPEVIDNGRRGLVVPPEDPQALAEAIIRCYRENLIEIFSKNIREDEDLFSWERLVKTIESFVK